MALIEIYGLISHVLFIIGCMDIPEHECEGRGRSEERRVGKEC